MSINNLGSICADYDDECSEVKCPTKCWIGNELTGPANGYCPLMSQGEHPMSTIWDNAPEWAQFIATDADGQEYWYEHEPTLSGRHWIKRFITGQVARVRPKMYNWQCSLKERP